MTPEQLDKIETDAKKATPGPWKVIGDEFFMELEGPGVEVGPDVMNGITSSDAQHIANTNPTATLELIAYIRELETQLATAHHVTDIINSDSTA